MSLNFQGIEEEKGIRLFVFIGMLCLIIGCDVRTAKFMIDTVEDADLTAIFLIAFGIVMAVGCTWLALKSHHPTRRLVALIAKLVIMACMLLCAFSISAYYREEKAVADATAIKLATGNAELDLETRRLGLEKERNNIANERTAALADNVVKVKNKTGSTLLSSNLLKVEGQGGSVTVSPSPSPTPQTVEDVKAKAGLKREGTDYKKAVTHWLADFARTAISWFPGTCHGVMFAVVMITIVFTMGGNTVTKSKGIQPPVPTQPASATASTDSTPKS